MKNITKILGTNSKAIVIIIISITIIGASYYLGTKNIIGDKYNEMKVGEITIKYDNKIETIEKERMAEIGSVKASYEQKLQQLEAEKNEAKAKYENDLAIKQKECDDKSGKLNEIMKILGVEELNNKVQEQAKEIETLK